MSNFPESNSPADTHQFKLFIEGDELYQAMLYEITNAQHSIQLESYIFACDEIGSRFITALIERASQGVNIQLNIDAAGSMFFRTRRQFQQLRKNNIKLHWFHRWSWRQPFRYNRRNHRKLLVIDNRVAFMGGFNIHRESSRIAFGEHRWRDTHLLFKGKLAKQAAQLFEHFWQGQHRWIPASNSHSENLLIPNNTHHCRYNLRCMLTEMFESATQTIYLTTPYFVPDRHTQLLLQSAAQKGIDVRLLVPRKNDVQLVRWAASAAYDGLLKSGVKIYEYLPRMLHAKTIIVDKQYATLGTANLDYRSFFLNYELNIFSRNNILCQQLQEQFLTDIKLADEILSRKWKYRFWGNKILEFIGWLARRWL